MEEHKRDLQDVQEERKFTRAEKTRSQSVNTDDLKKNMSSAGKEERSRIARHTQSLHRSRRSGIDRGSKGRDELR